MKSRRAAGVQRERDPLGMINGEGITRAPSCPQQQSQQRLDIWRRPASSSPSSEQRWLAHVPMLGPWVTPSNTTHPVDALKESLAETWPILAAALVPAVILLVLRIVGVEIRSAAWIAVIACTVLLTGSAASPLGWTQPWGQVLSACIGALLGIMVIGLKAGLHRPCHQGLGRWLLM